MPRRDEPETRTLAKRQQGCGPSVPGPVPGTRPSHRLGTVMTEPGTSSQPASQPLQPPGATESVLTLTAPAPTQAVAATAAPRLAPAVEAAALPGLDAKVEGYLTSLMSVEPRSPEFTAKATDVRTMGDDDIRRAAESSN